ncbi:alpha-tocopherol transfer protein-like [Nephila pilipes]|uniref:Alpha-tocopherol transfer protein-like n=1 Tax=Nephila pilipes TaxID=299642 RepID=A0A8X6PS19_NEPPI|nr:alpha-tocopherol transfer protein-like [Nephila pilipes]
MAAEYEEMMKTKGFLPHSIDCHHPELKQKAKDELGETDEIRGLALEQFRECILADEKLKNVLTDDEFLLLFLRARKYNIENSLSLLRNFFHTIAAHPEIFNMLDQEKIYKLAGSGFISTLPFRSNDGCFIIICKIGIWDPDEINEQVLFSLAMMLFLCAVNCPATQITGVRVIFDAEGYSFKQVRRFVPRYIPLVSKALRPPCSFCREIPFDKKTMSLE